MSPPWDVFGVGAAVGGAVGIYGGYQLRKLVVHAQKWNRRRKEKRKVGQPIQMYKDGEVITVKPEPMQLPPVIPIQRARRNTPRTADGIKEISANPDRDVVIAALTGSGYSRAEAIKAVDACSLAERASGPEHWTVAALSKAHGAKS